MRSPNVLVKRTVVYEVFHRHLTSFPAVTTSFLPTTFSTKYVNSDQCYTGGAPNTNLVAAAVRWVWWEDVIPGLMLLMWQSACGLRRSHLRRSSEREKRSFELVGVEWATSFCRGTLAFVTTHRVHRLSLTRLGSKPLTLSIITIDPNDNGMAKSYQWTKWLQKITIYHLSTMRQLL